MTDKDNTMKSISVRFTKKYLEAMDFLIAKEYFPNRGELIRSAVRDLYKQPYILDLILKERNKKKTEISK